MCGVEQECDLKFEVAQEKDAIWSKQCQAFLSLSLTAYLQVWVTTQYFGKSSL
jgi:hypothetical protein